MTNRSQNRKWIERGAWAIADQGLFAMANVLLNVLLARWLTPEEYGSFAVAYSCFLLIGAFHTALLTEPLLVFGAGKYAEQPRSYLGLLLRGHWLLTAVGSLLLIASGLVLRFNGVMPLSQALLGLALATPFSLLMWFGRRAAYVRFQPRFATMASAGYFAFLATGLIGLAHFQLLSIFSAMLTLGVAGAITGLWLLTRIDGARAHVEKGVTARNVARDHWRYGKWASATSVLMWVPLNLFFVALSVMVNFETTGGLKALSNLVLPMLQANAALGALLLPAMAQRAGDLEQIRKLLRTALVLFAVGAAAYALLIGAFGGSLVHLIYGGRYDSQIYLLRLLLLIPLLDGVMVVLSTALSSLELPRRIFWAQVTVVFCLLTIGVTATRLSGVWGATAALVIAELAGTVVLGAGVLLYLKRQASACTSFASVTDRRQTQVCRTFS